MFLYLPLQLPLLVAVAALLLAEGRRTWQPIQTETAQWLLTAVLTFVATLVAIALDRGVDPNHLKESIMWSAFLPPALIVLGVLRVCLFALRRLNVSYLPRALIGGVAAAVALAFAPVTALAAGCVFRGACP